MECNCQQRELERKDETIFRLIRIIEKLLQKDMDDAASESSVCGTNTD